VPHLPVHKASLRIVLYTISNKKIKPSNSFVFPGAPSGPYDIREELRFASVRSCYRQSRGLLGGGISTSQGRYIQTQTSMPRMGFEPKTVVFKVAKTIRTLYTAATGIGPNFAKLCQMSGTQITKFFSSNFRTCNDVSNFFIQCLLQAPFVLKSVARSV
jgi:hypothetical protein